MRNPERISKILTELSEIWIQCPDFRLGQLLLNVVNDPALYYIEDEDLIKRIKVFYNNRFVNLNLNK